MLGIDQELWPYVIIEANWKDNKWFKRRREVLHNTRIREENSWYENIFRPVTTPPWLRNLRSVNVDKGPFLAEKCLRTYLCLFADFWASSIYDLDTYTVNLELNDNFKMFYDHIYLNIYDIYHSWVSYNWATYPEAISVENKYFGLFFLKSSSFDDKKS